MTQIYNATATEKEFAKMPKAPNPSAAFKDYGWFLTRDDKRVILKITHYTWREGNILCSKVWKRRASIQKIVAPAFIGEAGSCEIFVIPGVVTSVTSFVLKISNIIRI